MTQPPTDPINELLAAASAPGTSAELRREDHTVMMFNAAHLASLSAPRSETMQTPRRFAVKSLVAGIAALTFASAGIAMAATGNLPGTGTGQGNGVGNGNGQGVVNANPKAGLADETESPAPDEATEAPSGDETEPTEDPTATDDPTATEAATPKSLKGQCRAISVGNKTERGKALESPPFAALIEAAGGIENVAAYCAELLGDEAVKPGKPEKTDKPVKTPNENKPDNTGKPESKDKKDKKAKKDKNDKPAKDRGNKPEKP